MSDKIADVLSVLVSEADDLSGMSCSDAKGEAHLRKREEKLRKAHAAVTELIEAAVDVGWQLSLNDATFMVNRPRASLALIRLRAALARVAPSAAYRWCERIDELIHGGPAQSEYADYALTLPAKMPVQPAPSSCLVVDEEGGWFYPITQTAPCPSCKDVGVIVEWDGDAYCYCPSGKKAERNASVSSGAVALSPWPLFHVNGLQELVDALERADQKGYLPDALQESWDAFDFLAYAPSPQTIPEDDAPTVCAQLIPGYPCPVPQSCREDGCSAVERRDCWQRNNA